MPYDPTFPVTDAFLISAEFRNQFNGLFDLIQTIPVGPPGPQGNPGNDGAPGSNGSDGQQGPPFTSFAVESTTTLDPGLPASVQASFDGTFVQLSFGIPLGPEGPQGVDGANGSNGTDGAPGPEGPPFTSFVADSVTTLDPSQPATVTANFDGSFVRFAFGIPRGNDGAQGPQGLQGAQGPQGDVTEAQLAGAIAGAIAGTPANTNALATLDIAITDPPTQDEVTQVLAKLNELIVALRRPV